MQKPPSYDGNGLANLISELELRLTGNSQSPGLGAADLIPSAETYVLVLFDGLGVAQLQHPAARSLSAAMTGQIEAPFPTTTSVSLSTIATGLMPSQHGQVAHLMWMEDLGKVVNTLKWVTMTGEPVSYDYGALLPKPNLWERLRAAGVEPITVQPGDFTGSPLTRTLYRGARFEGAWNVEDLIAATAQLAGEPNRLIFTYVPHVDFAGHVFGLESAEFTDAIKTAVSVWEGIAAALPLTAALIGTADHGLLEFSEQQKQLVRDPRFGDLRLAGDTRGIHMWGEQALMLDLAELTGGDLVDPLTLIGPEPTESTRSRLGEYLLLSPHGKAVIPRGFDKRLRCYHGGLTADEVEIPILVA